MAYIRANRAVALSVGCLVSTMRATAVANAQASVAVESAALARFHDDGTRLVRARRTHAAIVIDGRLDDAAWASAEVATDFVQQRPTPGAHATQRTEARVMFDGEALYVAMRLFDTHPDSLLAPLGRRDYVGYGDWAHVIIDSYHDRRTGFHFAVNPAGTRRDGMISNDAEWQEDPSWDAVWDVATSRDSLGWTAEFRVPLTQLRFESCHRRGSAPVGLARQKESTDILVSSCVWGIQFMRDLGRRNERSVWAPIAADAGGYVSRFGVLGGVDAMRSPRRVEVVPYSLAKTTHAPVDPANPFSRRVTYAGALGGDINLGLTSKLGLTATINPDFGQVEADPSEVNLTGAETFVRERRPFFVEGADIFRYTLGDGFFFGDEELFHSRRIGRTPQVSDPDSASTVDRPDATTILGAAKVSGKIGPWTLGVLDAVTGAERAKFATDSRTTSSFLAEPTTNYAVARLWRDAAGGRNSVGVVVTAVHRDLDPAAAAELRSSAVAAGVDGHLTSADRSYTFAANLLGSSVRGSPAAITETQRSTVHLQQRPEVSKGMDTTRTSLAGLSAELRASKVGGGHWRWSANGRAVTSGFEVNDVGFQLRSDVVSGAGSVGYVHFEPSRAFRRWEVWSNQWARWTFDGAREQMTSNVFASADFQNSWSLNTELRREYSRMSPTLLRGGPATYVPPSVTWWARLVSDPRRVLSGDLVTRGFRDDAGGGHSASVSPSITVRPSSRLEVSLQPTISRLVNPAQYVTTASAAGDTTYVVGALDQTTTSLTARLDLTFTPTLSLQLYAQPFLSAGDYGTLGEIRAARDRRLRRRIVPFATSAISTGLDDEWRIDRGDGRAPISIDAPEFTVRELKSNAVLRWEYRPGSALFVVWAQSRDDDASAADFSVRRQARDLWGTAGTNVLLIKASYWLTP